jgi:hypothetical protein
MIVGGVIIQRGMRPIVKMGPVIHHKHALILKNLPILQLAHHRPILTVFVLEWHHVYEWHSMVAKLFGMISEFLLIRVLEKQANDEDWEVRYWVAQHPNCPISSLEKLANDKDSVVRSWVAMHPNCPISSLEKLANDKHRTVRYWVAEHPNCPQYLKEYFKVKNFISRYESYT